MQNRNIKTVDEYISFFPVSTASKLRKIRQIINQEAPEAEEIISYQMPAVKLRGRILVYFAAFKNHIGFFPTSSGVKAFNKELTDYKTSKGTIQFPFDEEIPLNLVRRIVEFRVKEN